MAPPQGAGPLFGRIMRLRIRFLGTTFFALLVASPRFRAALVAALRGLSCLLTSRLSRFRHPPLRKDFLGNVTSHKVSAGLAVGDASSSAFFTSRIGMAQQQHSRGSPGTDESDALKSDGALHAVSRFSDFASVLPGWLADGLQRSGFDQMKPIQRRVLPLALSGQDVVGIAPTGSGKTLAFLVPGIVHAAGQTPLLKATDGPIVLVLAPTRELAVQIGSVAENLLSPSRKHAKGARFNSAVLYGGPRRTDQLQTLRFQQSTQLIVATPGRLLDFLRHGAFKLNRVSFFVLDEGDRMLDEGFEPDVTMISSEIREDRQMLFFSATWPPEVEIVAKRLCARGQTFQRVSVQGCDLTSGDGVEQGNASGECLTLPGHAGIMLPPREICQVVEVIKTGLSHWSYDAAMELKMPLLLKYLEEALGGQRGSTQGKALIFVSSRNAAEQIGSVVAQYFGLERCGVMHGGRKQDQREATLKAFREGRLRGLVSTDVLGRGVDIAHVSHVIIFDFPGDIETYVHRVGRTGRNGQSGISVAFFEPQPWYPNLAHELAEVLRSSGQEVPSALAKEERSSWDGQNGGHAWTPMGTEHSTWQQDATPVLPDAPPLDTLGGPPLATADELRDWHAGGARVWGYSANGGVSEQGRLEFRTAGLLRTTWGWGEWVLVHPEPHCPAPSRACPPLPHAVETPPTNETVASTLEGGKGDDTAVVATLEKLASRGHYMALSWNGVTDIVALDTSGLAFELVSRNGRPSSSYRKKTLGRALLGITL